MHGRTGNRSVQLACFILYEGFRTTVVKPTICQNPPRRGYILLFVGNLNPQNIASQSCQPSRFWRETPDFSPNLPPSRFALTSPAFCVQLRPGRTHAQGVCDIRYHVYDAARPLKLIRHVHSHSQLSGGLHEAGGKIAY